MTIEYIENQKDFFSYTFLFSLLLNGEEDKGAKKAKKPQKLKNYLKKENTMKWYILISGFHIYSQVLLFYAKKPSKLTKFIEENSPPNVKKN